MAMHLRHEHVDGMDSNPGGDGDDEAQCESEDWQHDGQYQGCL